MRIAADPNDPDHYDGRATITLDGEPVVNCVVADEEAGYVRVIDTLENEYWNLVDKHGVVKIDINASDT